MGQNGFMWFLFPGLLLTGLHVPMGWEESLSHQEQERPAGLWSLVPTGLGYHILFGQVGFLPLPACHKTSFPTGLGYFFQFPLNAGSQTTGPTMLRSALYQLCPFAPVCSRSPGHLYPGSVCFVNKWVANSRIWDYPWENSVSHSKMNPLKFQGMDCDLHGLFQSAPSSSRVMSC